MIVFVIMTLTLIGLVAMPWFWRQTPVFDGQSAGPGGFARALCHDRKSNCKQEQKTQMKTQSIKDKDQSLTNVNRPTPTQFAYLAPTARQVSLVGDFNNWDPKAGPMQKGTDGVWNLSVALKPGRYEYRFFADEVWCDDPAAREKTANSLGTENCVRVV